MSATADVDQEAWFWVITDAVIVLCAGVLTGRSRSTLWLASLPLLMSHRVGIASACKLLAKLARDHVLPRASLAAPPYTKALYAAVLSFVGFSGAIYASTGADLIVVSKM